MSQPEPRIIEPPGYWSKTRPYVPLEQLHDSAFGLNFSHVLAAPPKPEMKGN